MSGGHFCAYMWGVNWQCFSDRRSLHIAALGNVRKLVGADRRSDGILEWRIAFANQIVELQQACLGAVLTPCLQLECTNFTEV